MQTFDVIAEACRAEGVRALFTIMGDGNKRFLVAAAGHGIKLLHVRHEGAGLAMADGYARATGEVGVCSVTYSAGLTQLGTSLMVAAQARTPLVVVAGDLPSAQRGFGSQIDIDQATLVRACGAVPVPVRSPATAGDDTRIAFATARRQRRPVVLLAPVDIQEADAPAGTVRPAVALSGGASAAAAPAALTAAVEALTASRQPVVLAGRGAVAAGAAGPARRVADRLGALLATTLPAKGFLDEDPHSVGVAGSFADWRARRLLSQADCVLAAGASLNAYTMADGTLFTDAVVVQVDTDPTGPDLTAYDLAARRGQQWLPVAGDAAAVLAQLCQQLPARSARWRDAPDVRRLLAADPRTEAITATPATLATGTMDPRELMRELDRALPADATVVIGVGNFTWFPVQYLRNPGDRRFLPVVDFVAIGQAVPSAIGAATGQPDRPVVAIEGDASFMMHVQELETAARYDLPVLVLVLNDGALGAEYHKLKAVGADIRETILPSPDVCDVAAALGARAMRIHRPDEVWKVVDWYDPAAGPHVVDCPTSRSVAGPA